METVLPVMMTAAAVARPATLMPAPAAMPVAAPDSGAPPTAADTQQLNDLLQQHQHHLAFSVDDDSGRSIIKVIDTASGDVIRQMPSESWLKLAQELARHASGLLKAQA